MSAKSVNAKFASRASTPRAPKFVFPSSRITGQSSQIRGPSSISRPGTAGGDPRHVLRAKVNGKDFAIVARRGSYRAANNPRSRVQTPYGGSGDQQTDPWSRRIIREMSRDMERNCDTYRILLDDWSRWIVGSGVKAMPTTKDAKWNELAADLIDKKFKQVEGGLDCRQRKSWYQLQADFARAVAMDGDAGILKLANFRIQMLESEQITSGTSSISGGQTQYSDGVNLNAAGAAYSYTVLPYDGMTGALDYGLAENYDAEFVQFTANVDRFSQTRGMPLMVAGLDDWERIDSYRESEVIAAEQGSLIYGAIEYPEGQMGFAKAYLPGQTQPGGPASGESPSAGFNGGWNNSGEVDWHGSNAGYMMELPNGAKYIPVNPQRPNKDAAPFMIELLRQFCGNGGLPYEIVYNDLRGLSWSVHRGMVALARDKIRSQQIKLFANPFGNIYLWALANLIESGELAANEEWESYELVWPEISWPDEGKEYEAQTLGLSKGLTTRHRLFGPSWRKMIDERMEEINYAAELCLEFNKKYLDSEDDTDAEDTPDDKEDSDSDGDGVGENGLKAADADKSKSAKDKKKPANSLPGNDGDAQMPAKKNAAGFRITPQELLGYVDFMPPKDENAMAGADNGIMQPGSGPGAKKQGGKVGGADELKNKDSNKSKKG